MRWPALISTILATLLLLFSPARSEAHSVSGGEAIAVCLAKANTATPSTTEIARRLRGSGDYRYDCTSRQRMLGSGDFWVRSETLPPAAGRIPTYVRSISLWQERATLAILYADNVIVTRHIDGEAAARSLALGGIFQDTIPVRGVRAVRLLWHVQGSANMRGVLLNAKIATREQSQRADTFRSMFYSGFAGLALALLAYNLSLWMVLRHRFQLAYCVMVLALVGYAISSSGVFGWWWPELGNNARMRVNYVMLGVAGIAAVRFSRHYFEPRVFTRGMRMVADGVVVMIAASMLLFVLLAPWQARLFDLSFSLSFVALIGFALLMLVQAWRKRSNYLWLFALAWAAPIVLAAVRVASGFGLVPTNVLLDNSTLASMAAEALLSSVAIIYRIRVLMVERDEARAQETAARLLADSDPLTGLMNRRAFLREGIGGGERMLLLADIDHFRTVNDTLGHVGGDEVLRRVAVALQDAAPPGALVARLGGEEFAILCPAGSPLAPEAVLVAVRSARMPFDITVTVSLGTATGVMDEEADWTRLYRLADEALYAAKNAGRDRARCAEAARAA